MRQGLHRRAAAATITLHSQKPPTHPPPTPPSSTHLEPLGSGRMVASPGFQPAGHTWGEEGVGVMCVCKGGGGAGTTGVERLARVPRGSRCIIRGHRPGAWAHLIGVGLDVLDGLQGAQGLVHAAAKAQVVDGRVLHHALLVDDEQTAQRNALLGEDPVGL